MSGVYGETWQRCVTIGNIRKNAVIFRPTQQFIDTGDAELDMGPFFADPIQSMNGYNPCPTLRRCSPGLMSNSI